MKRLAAERRLEGPVFVGQGCTKRCGSDSYGFYVAEILKPGRLVALVDADEEFETSWADGNMKCEFPSATLLKAAAARPEGPCREFSYAMRYGRSWYWCDVKDGKVTRRPGDHARLSWNGAFSYRDPSF